MNTYYVYRVCTSRWRRSLICSTSSPLACCNAPTRRAVSLTWCPSAMATTQRSSSGATMPSSYKSGSSASPTTWVTAAAGSLDYFEPLIHVWLINCNYCSLVCEQSSVELWKPSRKDDFDDKDNRKRSRGQDKMKREASVENLSIEQKSIRDKLLGFIKRRPTADLLVKKGIYQVRTWRCYSH